APYRDGVLRRPDAFGDSDRLGPSVRDGEEQAAARPGKDESGIEILDLVMDCDEVEDLLGAYALEALPGDLWADVSAHLATCSKHAEPGELRAVASALAFAAPEAQPSAALKTRLMDAVRAESSPPAAVPKRIGILGPLRQLASRRAIPYALAGALAVALIALVLTNLDGGDSTRPGRATVSLSGENSAGA